MTMNSPMTTEQMQAQLSQMLQAQQAQPVQVAPMATQMQPQWNAPQTPFGMMPAGAMVMQQQAAPSPIQGLMVPIQLNLPNGNECTVYALLGPEAAQNPVGAVGSLMATGANVKAYPPRQRDNGGGWGGRGGNGGGWNNNSGNGRGGWGR